MFRRYYATKLPSKEELLQNPDVRAVRAAEDKFFSSTSPWSTLPLEYKSRLGVLNLRDGLSKVLKRYIVEQCVPSLASFESQP